MIREILTETVTLIESIQRPHPIRVRIDGPSASGKTTFADQLAKLIRTGGKPVIRASIDGFHNPPHIRNQKGEQCPKGYVEDSFDKKSVIRHLLEPLGPNGNLLYLESQYDFVANQKTRPARNQAKQNAILVFEGVMLFCDELRPYFDIRIYIDSSSETVIKRALKRDSERLGGETATLRKYKNRYIPGQSEYIKRHNPLDKAHMVIDNNDYSSPRIIESQKSTIL